jgi:hypothetical protein
MVVRAGDKGPRARHDPSCQQAGAEVALDAELGEQNKMTKDIAGNELGVE